MSISSDDLMPDFDQAAILAKNESLLFRALTREGLRLSPIEAIAAMALIITVCPECWDGERATCTCERDE